MNSFRYRKSQASKAILAAVVAAAAMTSFAFAQDAVAPAVALPGLDANQEIKAPSVKLPDGATIGDAREKVRTMATEGGKALDELIGNSVTPRTETEVGAYAEKQRNIMMLKLQLEEAELAKKLWVEVKGETEENSDKITKLTEEKNALEAEVNAMRLLPSSGPSSSDPDPVVSSVSGASGEMTAVVLVPYSGEFSVERGTLLPNGMKVVSISKSGVTVQDKGSRKALAFGTSVPKSRPVITRGPAGSAGGANIMQQISR